MEDLSYCGRSGHYGSRALEQTVIACLKVGLGLVFVLEDSGPFLAVLAIMVIMF